MALNKSEKGFPGPLSPGAEKARKRAKNDFQPKGLQTVVSKPWLEIPDEAEVKSMLQRGKREAEKR